MNRDTPNIFDLIFKKLLRISKKALICLINAQFHTRYPLNSSVEYLSTEHISKYLGHIFSDSLIKIAGKDLYHFEAEIENNPEMILRLYVYGFEIGMERKEVKQDKIIIRFPQVKVFYWKPNSRTPERMSLTLVFPDGTPHEYWAETYKPLEHSIDELVEQKLVLLLPFHLLKLLRAAKKARTAKERKALVGEMRKLAESLVEATKAGVRERILTSTERSDILDLMVRLQNEVYGEYTEIKETGMEIVNGEIRTLSEQISDLKAGLALVKKQAKRQVSSVKKQLENERYNTARRLKTLRVSTDKIAAATGLTPEEIQRL
jgi:hypothetical protein